MHRVVNLLFLVVMLTVAAIAEGKASAQRIADPVLPVS